jgi:predicted transcriptional regulator
MSDFTAEDLFDTVDRLVGELLAKNGFAEPPVDAVVLAQEAFDLTVREADDEDDPRDGRFGPRPPRVRHREVVFRPDQSEESRHAVCARACAKEMIPAVLARVGVAPGTENKSAQSSLVGLIAPRLLLPTRWFERDARKAGYDLFAVKQRYPTAGYEMIALRMLELDEPCVIAVVDDGIVSARRGNRTPATKTLTPAEQLCLERIGREGDPESQTVRRDGWTVHGWPVPSGPFNRIILRAVPEDV